MFGQSEPSGNVQDILGGHNTQTGSITTEVIQSVNVECSGTDVTCTVNQGLSRHDIGMSSIRNVK